MYIEPTIYSLFEWMRPKKSRQNCRSHLVCVCASIEQSHSHTIVELVRHTISTHLNVAKCQNICHLHAKCDSMHFIPESLESMLNLYNALNRSRSDWIHFLYWPFLNFITEIYFKVASFIATLFDLCATKIAHDNISKVTHLILLDNRAYTIDSRDMLACRARDCVMNTK